MKKHVNTKESGTIKTPTFTTVNEIITGTNDEIADDMLYICDDIFVPEKKDLGRFYRGKNNFTLKTKKEARELMKEKKIKPPKESIHADFFVYNERTNQLLPFKKNDYLMYDRDYLTFDGTNYITYDNNGIEIGRF